MGNWIKACQRIIDMDVEAVVPGHGPITDKAGVAEVKGYLEYISAEARKRFDAGQPAAEAAREEIVDGLDTSYVCTVDSQGNLFSATPSDASSESPIIPGLGFAPSSRGTQSWADPAMPACMAPGKRPRLTPNRPSPSAQDTGKCPSARRATTFRCRP